MTSCGTFQKLRPLSLLNHLSSSLDSAHLKVCSNSVSWSIHLEQGKIIYASHSVEPFDRLDCHLRRLGHKISTLVSETRAQLRIMFETGAEQSIQNPDYQAICWLVNQQHLSFNQAAELIENLVKEVIESFLLVEEGTYELGETNKALPEFCRLDLKPIVEHCQNQLQGWQSLGSQIWSPYQRPYFLNRNRTEQLSPEIQQKLTAMLKGFSFRHLAILLNQEELQLAQSLHPYIIAGTILLDEPYPPFDQLPKICKQLPDLSPPESVLPPLRVDPPIPSSTISTNNAANSVNRTSPTAQLSGIHIHHEEKIRPAEPTGVNANKSTPPLGVIPVSSASKVIYKIVCVDDSPTMLKELSYFLEDESFSVFTISDPVKALMQIVRLKPDLILLDVRMSGINGYELCRLLRNHSLFKNTPIIMVTGNTGIIDRVRAKLVGASGYLTKPFTQPDLLKIVFRHLL